MREIIRLAIEINVLAESVSPVIHDLSERLVHLLEAEKLYTHTEVMKIVERTDPDINDDQRD